MPENPLSTPTFGEIGVLTALIVNGDGSKVIVKSTSSLPETK